MACGAAILAPEGLALNRWETDFFRDFDPWGFILFARNVERPAQLLALCSELRDCVGRDAPILIDQEGGRVQRLGPPHWRAHLPPLDMLARASDPERAFWLRNRMIAAELRAVGIDANCVPALDVAREETHPFLRNRLYGDRVDDVSRYGRICAEAHLAGGVLPVIKHIPGHGLGTADSHLSLPVVEAGREELEDVDFAPFAELADLPMGMTAHVLYTALDDARCATLSPEVISIIRFEIGFDGLLMSDDISMKALEGDVGDLSEAAIAAGCDVVLHCNGERGEMEAVALAVGEMNAPARMRGERALTRRGTPVPIDIAACEAEFDALLA